MIVIWLLFLLLKDVETLKNVNKEKKNESAHFCEALILRVTTKQETFSSLELQKSKTEQFSSLEWHQSKTETFSSLKWQQ